MGSARDAGHHHAGRHPRQPTEGCLEVTEEDGLLTLHIAGDRPILVYPKPDHTPATFTILNLPVDDIESTVDQLAARGVDFERYTRARGSPPTRRASSAAAGR